MFSKATKEHIARTHSDYAPLLIRLLETTGTNYFNKPFKFLLAWHEYEGFENFLERVWMEKDSNLGGKIALSSSTQLLSFEEGGALLQG